MHSLAFDGIGYLDQSALLLHSVKYIVPQSGEAIASIEKAKAAWVADIVESHQKKWRFSLNVKKALRSLPAPGKPAAQRVDLRATVDLLSNVMQDSAKAAHILGICINFLNTAIAHKENYRLRGADLGENLSPEQYLSLKLIVDGAL